MDKEDYKKSEIAEDTQDNLSKTSPKSEIELPSQPLSQNRKIFLALVFVMGLALSYPTVLPFSIVFSAILLFQENRKATIAGIILIAYQIMWVLLVAPSLG